MAEAYLNIEEKVPSISRNVFWVSVANIFGRLLNFLLGIIIARILFPEDFGIIGMAATFSGLIDVFSRLGIEAFIISKQNITKNDINSVYLLNIMIGLLFAIVMILGGPLVSILYKTPEVKNILIFSAISFFMCSLSSIPRALLVKDMKQNIISKIEMIQNFLNVSLIILFAFCGFRYLSFVIPLTIVSSITTAIYLYLTKWHFHFELEYKTIKQTLNYAKSFMPKTILQFLVYNSDYIFIGFLLGSKLLGYYYFGFEKAVLAVGILMNITCSVFFPVFSKHQSDKILLKDTFFQLVSKQTYIMYPIIFIQMLLASEVMNLVWGNRWDSSVFTFLCISGYVFVRIMSTIIHVLFDAIGHPEYNLKHFLIAAPICIIGLLIGTKFGGLKGVSIAALVVHLLAFFLLLIRSKYMMKWSLTELLKSFAQCFIPILVQLPIIIPLKLIMHYYHVPNWAIIIMLGSFITVLYLYFSKLFLYDIYVLVFVSFKQKMLAKLQLVKS